MGLDLSPVGRALPQHAEEWARTMSGLYQTQSWADEAAARIQEISIPPHADIGAPQVGVDPEANAWLLNKARQYGDMRPEAEIIQENKGYHAVELLLGKSDGVPPYSNAALGYVEAISFRGEFLKDCSAFLGPAIVGLAWRDLISPRQAVEYGELLLSQLDRPAASPTPEPGWPTIADKLRSVLQPQRASVQEQRQIVDAAGRWYVFWGKRGNPIHAYY